MKTHEQLYNKYVKSVTPMTNTWKNMFNAFWIGGAICALGQVITNILMYYGMDKDMSAKYTTLLLVLISVILTGCNIYWKIAKIGGAGTLVPITGFANSVAAPAMEYTNEGEVFGVGCKIFTIAGPVILYGIFSSWVLGFVYWIGKIFGWW